MTRIDTPALIDTDEIVAMNTEALRDELSKAIGITAHAIRYVAAIWHELERRGEDLSEVRFSLRDHMAGVATGRVLPELVATFAGQTRTLNLLAALPVGEQKALLGGRPISVYKGENADPEEISVTDITYPQAALAIRDGRIRPLDEQRLAARRSSGGQAKKKRGRRHKIVVRPEEGRITIGIADVAIEDVLAALRAARVLD